ncbi:hypothetical protein J7E50_07240 [Pedobacter sp. ISL-68]|uniref:hypothetical protein n=2 Tax=unclassified Pedobacter TaxID=2628915 RepID=UPI001BEB7C72|nr:hypothetical protein [Pedobacter sp. ISL-64]MBT2560625.1 hypothetical protein [Pedobacter sp. ISL-64]MBT2590004.1 hypothetical protein [Pedobacter sp. ISL-68]
MKNILSKVMVTASIVVLSMSACKKDPNAEKEVSGTGGTTIELAKGAAISATGTVGTSVVTLNYIVGEKLFPSKVIPKLTVYYLANTQTSATAVSSSVRTILYTATNVSLTATANPATGAPVVTATGTYGNSSNTVWGLTYTFNLSQIGKGLFTVNNGVASQSRGTSLIIVAQDASNATLAEYTFALSEFGLRAAL